MFFFLFDTDVPTQTHTHGLLLHVLIRIGGRKVQFYNYTHEYNASPVSRKRERSSRFEFNPVRMRTLILIYHFIVERFIIFENSVVRDRRRATTTTTTTITIAIINVVDRNKYSVVNGKNTFISREISRLTASSVFEWNDSIETSFCLLFNASKCAYFLKVFRLIICRKTII